ncbi:MAG: glycosyltransferase family 8 protein [Bacteroidota bacterium]
MSDKKTISIVVASDNFYVILVAALLKSIELNHKTDEHIDFYIIDDGISNKNRKRIEEVADSKLITIKWVMSKDVIPTDVQVPIDNSGFPLTVYLRLFCPLIVDKGVDKIIYMDVDIIVKDDISNLWNINLGDYTIAAVQDVAKTVDCEWAGIPNYKALGIPAGSKYFNAGVSVINVNKWRDGNIGNKVIEALHLHKKHVILGDQYGLNVVFANKWLELDPKWNWFAFAENANPSLIHFLDIKPIFKTYNSQEAFKEEFFKYLSYTPWKSFKPISGNKRHLKKIYTKIKKMFMKF